MAPSRLSSVIKGKLACAKRYVVYGPEGVGKSSLAADAPNPIFFDVDDGSAGLDVARYQFHDGPGGQVPLSYEEVVAGIDDLIENAHDFQTLVVDTLDRLEAILWAYVVKHESGRKSAMNKGGVKFDSILELGYGNGYALAVDEWRRLACKLDLLRSRKNMSIVMLAHAQIRTFKNPEGEDFDRYSLRLNDKAAGFIREWADVTGFACFEQAAGKLGEEERAKGYSTGRRLLKLTRTATYDAKTRLALPEQVELDPAHPWKPLADAVADSDAQTPVTLASAIEAELANTDSSDLISRVKKATAEAVSKNDKGALSRILHALQKQLQQQKAAA